VTVLTADGAIQLGTNISELTLVSSPSSGLRRYTSDLIHEGALSENRIYLYIDAQQFASTPQRWSHHVRNLLNLPDASGSSMDQLEQTMQLPGNPVIYIDNAEDFLLLNRYPGCSQFIDRFADCSAKHSLAWILAGKSPDRFTRYFSSPVKAIESWNYRQVERYLESRGFFIRESLLSWIVSISSGFPEYLIPFTEIAVDHSDLDSFLRRTRSECINPESRLFLSCKLNWLEILHQARGYCSLKGILTTVALYPNSRLSDLARQLSNSAPAVKDYLKALMKVGAIRRSGWTYALQDPVMALWLKENHASRSDMAIHSEIAESEPARSIRLKQDDSFLEFD